MNEQYRPKLKLKIRPLELILNSVGMIIFTGSLVYLITVWTILPGEVPAHYNGFGEVDRWGSKWEMLILPVISLMMWIGMTILERYPHVYNYKNVTKENVRAQYLNGRMMINVLKNLIVVIFVYLTWKDVKIALGQQDSLGVWFLPVFLILIFGATGYFIAKSLRLSKG